MSRFFRDSLTKLKPYTPGEQPREENLIKLNTNENPFPPGPRVVQVMANRDEIGRLHKYPDPEGREARVAVAREKGIKPENVIMTNGSDEALAFIFMAYGEKVVAPEISYGFYPVYGDLFGSEYETVPMKDDFYVDISDYMQRDGMVIIANPNSPTGMEIPVSDIERLVASKPDDIVVVDQAYMDFGQESAVPLIDKYDNLLVVETLSKSRSLAGLRIGMAMGSSQLIEDLQRIRYSFNPYNLDRLSIEAAKAAMDDREYFAEKIEAIKKTRDEFVINLKGLGMETLPSSANFVMVKGGKDYYEGLRREGILVRYFGTEPLNEYVRITIGLESDMKRVLEATEGLLCEGLL